jgi:hypothetical protein
MQMNQQTKSKGMKKSTATPGERIGQRSRSDRNKARRISRNRSIAQIANSPDFKADSIWKHGVAPHLPGQKRRNARRKARWPK